MRLVRALRGQRPRGLILAASRTDGPDAVGLKSELDAFASMGGRVVMLGPGGVDVRSVAVDNRGGSAQLGAELAALGYREAVIVGAEEGIRTSDDRIAGFTEGFTGGGGTHPRGASRRLHARRRLRGREGAARRRHPRRARSSSASATSSRSVSCRRSGMPAAPSATDVAVAGFDDIATGRDIRPGLTTVRVPLEDLGYRALRAAVEAEWDAAQPTTPLEVIVRGSTPRLGCEFRAGAEETFPRPVCWRQPTPGGVREERRCRDRPRA